MDVAAPGHPPDLGHAPTGRRASENAALLSMATVAARLGAFGLAVVMGRQLGPAGYGLYAYALAVGFVLVPVADLGLTPYLTREVARDRAQGEALIDHVLQIRAATSAGLAGLVALVAMVTGASSETLAVVVIVVVSGLVDGLSLVFFGYFVGRERMALEAGLTASTALVRAIGGIAIVLITGELVPVAVWILAVGVGQIGWAWVRLRAERGDAVRETPAVRWRTVLSLGSTAIAVMVYLRADTVLVGWLAGESEVGWYAAAYTLLLGLQIVPHMIGRALFPVFARTWVAGHSDSFVGSWQTGIRAVLLISLPLSLAVSVLAAPVIGRFFGPGFGPAGDALAILVWSSPLAALNSVVFGALLAAGRDSLLTRVSIGGALGNVALNLWAIPAYGIEGAAAVTVGTEVVILLAQTLPAIVSGLLPFPRLPYARLGLSLAVLASVALLLRDQTVEVALFGSLVAYALTLAVTRVLHSSDVAAARALMPRRSP